MTLPAPTPRPPDPLPAREPGDDAARERLMPGGPGNEQTMEAYVAERMKGERR